MHRIAPFALCICALVAGADELTFAHPLLGQPVVVSWSLEQLTSAPGEPETHAPVAASDKGIRLRMSRSELPHGTLVVTVVATNASDRRFFLRPVCSVTVHDGKNRFFNGYEDTRTLTFDPDDVMLSNWFPTNAAYDGDSALILGLDPMQLYSRVDAGRNEVEGGRISLSLALPFVLDPKQTFEYSFVIAACASRYGRRDIIQHWYDVFDTAFRPPSDIDPNVISGESTYLFWKPEAYGLGSTGDLIRRMFGGRGSWEWCYAPFVRGGDWAITDAWSVGFKGHSAEAVEARRTRIRQRMSGARRLDIAPMWYVNVAYTEKTMWEKHFPGIVASDKPSIRRCWSQDVVYPVYSWGNAYADLFVESLNRIPRDYPVTRGIGWDSCFAHRRLPVSVDGVLNTARKSYRDGEIFALEAVGIANLLDVNHRNRAGGYRMANAVNYKLVSPYAIGVRTDAALFEGHPMRTRNRLQRYESMRARLGTRKALVWHKGAAPNEIRWIDWEDMSADTARDAYRQVLENDLFLSYYWGATPAPGMPTLGVSFLFNAIPELVDLIRLGWQPSPAADAPADFFVSRYGQGPGSRIVVINPRFTDQQADMRFPATYWNGGVPLLAREDGKELTVELTAADARLSFRAAPRSITILRACGVADLDGIDRLTLRSKRITTVGRSPYWLLTAYTPDRAKWTARFARSEPAARVKLRVNGDSRVFVGNQPVETTFDSRTWDVDVQADNLHAGRIELREYPRHAVESITAAALSAWAPVDAVRAEALIITTSLNPDPSAQEEAQRIQDWFAFYTGAIGDAAVAKIVHGSEAGGACIALTIDPTADDLREWQAGKAWFSATQTLRVVARDGDALHETVLALLNALDRVYPYYGVLPDTDAFRKLELAGKTLESSKARHPFHPTLLELARETGIK